MTPQWQKKSFATWEKIYFTIVIVALALLGLQISYSQNKHFFSLVALYSTFYYWVIKCILLPPVGKIIVYCVKSLPRPESSIQFFIISTTTLLTFKVLILRHLFSLLSCYRNVTQSLPN